jgi:Helix-turn-helix domain
MDIRHLNQVQLARRWNLSPRTLERWRWLHQGPQYLKIGGRIVYRLDDIEAYEAAQVHAPIANPAGAPAATNRA